MDGSAAGVLQIDRAFIEPWRGGASLPDTLQTRGCKLRGGARCDPAQAGTCNCKGGALFTEMTQILRKMVIIVVESEKPVIGFTRRKAWRFQP